MGKYGALALGLLYLSYSHHLQKGAYAYEPPVVLTTTF